jgi:hypothetical protein
MKKVLMVLWVMSIHWQWAGAQQYYSKTGKITFESKAPLETIEATNTSANDIIDAATGNVEAAVLIKGFQFEKALMQDHFNENYLESHRYPKATFKGAITNLRALNFEKEGTYKAELSGALTMHGVTQPVTTSGTLTVKGGKISVASTFALVVADYNIEIPKVVRDNISKTVTVRVTADLQKLATK